MDIPYYHVDAFTGDVFSGNPAGVCLLEGWPRDSLMQAIAAENGHSETAFVVRAEGRYELRWFTPKVEIDLCGHATLAAAHVLFEHAGLPADEVRFGTRSGELGVTRDRGLLVMDFPSRPAAPCSMPEGLGRMLGVEPLETLSSRDLLVVCQSEREVRAAAPDFASLAALEWLVIIVTAPGDNADFVSRCFAPRAGIDEDPVTGSAHCTLIPYWSARLARQELHALQVSQRGGELFCREMGPRVSMAGRAVTYMTGQISI